MEEAGSVRIWFSYVMLARCVPKELVGIFQPANPRIPRPVFKAVSKARNGVYDRDGGKRWVHAHHDIGDDLAQRACESNAALTKRVMDLVDY